MNMFSEAAVIVFDRLVVNIYTQRDLYLFPCKLTFCAHHPSKKLLSFLPLLIRGCEAYAS
jgi:hypothetical protein